MRTGAILSCLALLFAHVAAFMVAPKAVRMGPVMVATEVKAIATFESPDFYWQYRLDRLASKKGGDLAFNASNYPEAANVKDLYDAYYLDLTLQAKLDGFDWQAEKEITDAEWLTIYKNICQWSSKTVKENKPDTSNLPESDFDLLKQFYPQLNYRDLETPFVADEVGANFPYRTMKDMLSAAVNGKLNVPGYDAKKITSLEATEVRAELAALKEKSMKRIDSLYEEAMTFAKNPFPDAAAKTHYQNLRKTLADFPQTPAAWNTFRANMEKEVDEMARLASKKVDEHHHHGDDHHDDKPSPAQEFEAKYGRNLDEMQERFAKFKSDPEGFLESSILEKYGKNGLDIWKKSQEFSNKMAVMSPSEKAAAEAAFADFLKQA